MCRSEARLTAFGLLLALLPACGADAGVEREAAAPAEERPAIVSEAVASPAPARSAQQSADLDESRSTAIVRASSRVAPSVVSINVLLTRTLQPRSWWESVFLPPGAQRRAASFGSGVVVQDGIIVTNNHVIEGADQIRVTFFNGGDLPAELVGADPLADIAVLRVQERNLPVAPIGSVEELMIGEWAIAIGNPLGNYIGDTRPTVTAGVVSAIDRNITPSGSQEGFYLGMIQTDASINPGNSGGPLVNAAGEVIGINTSIISRSGGSEGLGFAIPIDRALRIVDDLLRFGEVRRAWIGIDVEPLEADAWGRTRGVRISRVVPGSPADAAALEPGDRLLAANRRPLTAPLDFEGVLLDLRAGDDLELTIDGRASAIRVEAVAFPSTTAERVRVLQDIEVISVTPQVRAERGLTSEAGALIVGISDEAMANTQLRPGDVIVGINRAPIRSAEDLAAIFDRLEGNGRLALTFERSGGYGVRNLYYRR
ncbi:MAG TPA: trypsin-like peptidase domain-containing protein [Longimicrobiales bacterium]|nr:trypsin-like peptidase domain-containing protein [Longimicrobiales bacterium]